MAHPRAVPARLDAELGLPDLSIARCWRRWRRWLQPAFAGKTRLDALSDDALADALKSGLDWSLRQRIDHLAPTRIDVPSGMQRAIAYQLDDAGRRPRRCWR